MPKIRQKKVKLVPLDPKERLSEVLDWLEVSGHLRQVQGILREWPSGLASGRSFSDIRAAAMMDDRHIEYLQALEPYVEQLALFGCKCLYLYELPTSEKKKIRDYVTAHRRSVKRWDISGDNTKSGVVLAENVDGNYARVVFRSVRSLTWREEVDPDHLKDRYREEIGPGVSLYAYKVHHTPVFDVIGVPFDDDQPMWMAITNGFNGYRMSADTDAIADALRLRLRSLTQISTDDMKEVELFGLVHPIYDDETEGRLSRLDFMVPSGATYNEKWKEPTKDLRQEPFHEGGVDNVSDITPYGLTVAWDELGYEVDLDLRGQKRMLSSGAGLVRALTSAYTRDEYQFVRNKLLQLLEKHGDG